MLHILAYVIIIFWLLILVALRHLHFKNIVHFEYLGPAVQKVLS